MRDYWQISAGNASSGRNYADLFLKHGLAFMGGDDQERAAEVRKGDVMILKDGLNRVLAAGLVVERNGRIAGKDDKAWVRDVEGCDLPAYVFVDWHADRTPIETKGFTRATIGKTTKAEHHAIADALLKAPLVPIEPEPEDPTVLSNEQIVADLQTHSTHVKPEAAIAALAEIQRVYREEFDIASEWTEEVTRDRLVRPLMESFGWTRDNIRDSIKGQGLSHLLCCSPSEHFVKSLDTKVIECRRFNHGVDLSPAQSLQIGKIFTGAKILAISNGVAMKLYSRPEFGSFKTEAGAYVNLARPAERCPSNPKLPGALTLLRFLLRK